MKVVEKNVMRLLAVQQLRAAYGIKTKNWNKNKAASCKSTASTSAKVFGVPLDSLPYYNMECGNVPSFLVDACMKLLAHVDTEGLFRKSGSIVRLKALRAKLEAGEECLSAALPCDVAGLVKQFFRELPEPVLPAELQDAFLKAQQLPTEDERTSATMLLSCVLPDRSICVLRHFFDFLHNVSSRSADNKMDSSNLSVILAPNLLHSGDGTEKMNANTEKRLKLQAAIVRCFIENASNFGVLPQSLQEKVPVMMGCEAGVLSPTHDDPEELDSHAGMKRKTRRSFGVFSSATPVIGTPSTKRKLPLESVHSFGFSNKKRRSVKKSLGFELLPNTLFSGTSTPGSVHSASGILESSQNTMSSAGKSRRQPATSARRKGKRLSNRHVINRVESGRAGCFSPKINKKEAPRKSLRLRFSLGRSSKDAGSQSIGLRLASQESTTSFLFTKEEISPSVFARKTESKCPKFISKSEDNLLTPQCHSSAHRTLWSGETPVATKSYSTGSFTDTPMDTCLKSNYTSEPTMSRSPATCSRPMKLCCALSAESLESERSITETLRQTSPALKIKKASTEPGGDPQASVHDGTSFTGEHVTKWSDCTHGAPLVPAAVKHLNMEAETCSFPIQQSLLANGQSIIFGQMGTSMLSPLHIDSAVFESSVSYSPVIKDGQATPFRKSERESKQGHCSKLIDALDIQSPAQFKPGVCPGLQSTPCSLGVEPNSERSTPTKTSSGVNKFHEKIEFSPEINAKVQIHQSPSPCRQKTENPRVADHIHHFNKLTLHSPSGTSAKLIRSPLKFQRTPVRQTVRRINSLLGERPSTIPERTACQSGHVVKAVSLESGLSPHPKRQPQQGRPQVRMPSSLCLGKKPPPVPPKRLSTLARKPNSCVLGDMTNKVQAKTKMDCSAIDPSGAQKSVMQQVPGKDMSHYRGSPRNPLNQGKLLSATKPIDL